MTSPAMSWYADQIRRSPALLWAYRRHKWRWYMSVRTMTSFSLLWNSDIIEYRKGQLTVRKDPPHPSWNVPEEYLAPVRIRLSPRTERHILDTLAQIPFPSLRTDPRSFVNLRSDGFVPVRFTARFPLGGVYHFACGSKDGPLAPLGEILVNICAGSEKYRQIQAMEAWLFDPVRLK